jgi:predicted glutamine amidotransferase
MCELFGLSSRQPTRATFSLDTFASHGAPPGGMIDGWGIAFYNGLDVRLHKEPEPASNSAWLAFIKQHRIISSLVISHIRRATMGNISLANTQPFSRELGGRMHVFAHNGNLTGIEVRYTATKRRFRPVGETDSEIAFCMLAERLSPLWSTSTIPTLDQRFGIICDFAAELRELGPANFLYADGDVLFAHGHRRIQTDGTIAPPGLWLLCRECAIDKDGLPTSATTLGGAEAGVTIEGSAEGQAITLLASVPLTGEGWHPLAEGELVAVKDGRVARRSAKLLLQQDDLLAAG